MPEFSSFPAVGRTDLHQNFLLRQLHILRVHDLISTGILSSVLNTYFLYKFKGVMKGILRFARNGVAE